MIVPAGGDWSVIAIECVSDKNGRDCSVPFFVYEAERVRHHRTVRALIFALILSIAINFACNIAWLRATAPMEVHYEEMQDG